MQSSRQFFTHPKNWWTKIRWNIHIPGKLLGFPPGFGGTSFCSGVVASIVTRPPHNSKVSTPYSAAGTTWRTTVPAALPDIRIYHNLDPPFLTSFYGIGISHALGVLTGTCNLTERLRVVAVHSFFLGWPLTPDERF